MIWWNYCTIINEYSQTGWWWLFCWFFFLLSSIWPRLTDQLLKLENISYSLLCKSLMNLCPVQPKLPQSIISSSLTFFIIKRVFYNIPRPTTVSILKWNLQLPYWYLLTNGAVTGLYKQWTQYLSPNTIWSTVVYFKLQISEINRSTFLAFYGITKPEEEVERGEWAWQGEPDRLDCVCLRKGRHLRALFCLWAGRWEDGAMLCTTVQGSRMRECVSKLKQEEPTLCTKWSFFPSRDSPV